VLLAHQLDARPSVLPPTPVAPEQRIRTDDEGMQQHADLTRLGGSAAVPLTLFAQGTGATTTDAGRIHHTQAAIDFSTLFLDTKFLVCWTTEGPVWLEREIVAREATSFPC
jgi:hypothetical protein